MSKETAMREAFEKWGTYNKGWNMSRNEDGAYFYHEQGWIAWQAALATTEAPRVDERETAGECYARLGIDGELWAKEMQSVCSGTPLLSTLHAWCANMIMAGYDRGFAVAKREENSQWPFARTHPPVEASTYHCPTCKGPADNGIDRCYPPNVYECTKCSAPAPASAVSSENATNEDLAKPLVLESASGGEVNGSIDSSIAKYVTVAP